MPIPYTQPPSFPFGVYRLTSVRRFCDFSSPALLAASVLRMAGNVCSGILGWSTVPLTTVLMPRGTIRRSAVFSIFLYSLLEAGMQQVIRLPASSLSGSLCAPGGVEHQGSARSLHARAPADGKDELLSAVEPAPREEVPLFYGWGKERVSVLQLVKALGGIIPDGDVDEAPLKAAIEDDLRDAGRVPCVLHEFHDHELLGLPRELLGEGLRGQP